VAAPESDESGARLRSGSGEQSSVPDVLAPGLACVFCGINPGRVSAAARAHFANPRNDFWRLLHDAGFTPRVLAPAEQFELLELGYGLTNAAYRTTPGSGGLRRGDFDASRLERLAVELTPRAIAFVGKEAYRGVFGERAELGSQLGTLDETALFVLPSTSPANAAVPYVERLRWFRTLHDWLEPVPRDAVRALVVDADERVLLLRWENPVTREVWWITPGGGIASGESDEAALRRELSEEAGARAWEIGPVVWVLELVLPLSGRIVLQRERFYLVPVDLHEVAPTVDLATEHIHGHRWWTLEELESTEERLAPRALATHLRALLADGPPSEPLDLAV
jgi:TDG/mug DNA glycosylase family protein